MALSDVAAGRETVDPLSGVLSTALKELAIARAALEDMLGHSPGGPPTPASDPKSLLEQALIIRSAAIDIRGWAQEIGQLLGGQIVAR